MKTYKNGMKATEFNKGQIGQIYKKAKNGELKVERFIMSDLYDMAEYYNYDHNGSAERAERQIKKIIAAVESNNTTEAQELIDAYTVETYNLLSLKAQKTANRELVK